VKAANLREPIHLVILLAVGMVCVLVPASASCSFLLLIDVSYAHSGSTFHVRSPYAAGLWDSAFTLEVADTSEVALFDDANKDGVTGDYTISSSVIDINSTLNITPDYRITIQTSEILRGGLGKRIGSDILWTSPAATLDVNGGFYCQGVDCELHGLKPNQIYTDLTLLNAALMTQSPPSLILGRWTMNSTFDRVLGSQRLVTGVGDAAFPGGPSQWWVFGENDLGFPAGVPEPCSAMLVALGLAGLALRSRKSCSQRARGVARVAQKMSLNPRLQSRHGGPDERPGTTELAIRRLDRLA
jgi:hypothetical protein